MKRVCSNSVKATKERKNTELEHDQFAALNHPNQLEKNLTSKK
jgi:hypothetical protein